MGRFLPEGKDQVGEVIVTGQRGAEKVRFVAKVNLKDAEEGNSFIPRLWARGHLDHLLAQGTNQFIRDEVIRMSEQFHIITPYTSLLVLESDADRERFGVQRRYEMRDGERFFTAGRDNANYELLQQQMKRAGDWRIGMRRQVLRSLAGLGRNSQLFQRQAQQIDQLYLGDRVSTRRGETWRFNMPMSSAGAPGSGPAGETYGFGGGGSGGLGIDDSFSTFDADDGRLSAVTAGFGVTRGSGLELESLEAATVSENLSEDAKASYDSESKAKVDASKHEVDEVLSLGVREEAARGADYAERGDYDLEKSFRQLSDSPFGSLSRKQSSLELNGPMAMSELMADYSSDFSRSGFGGRLGRPYYRGHYQDYTSWVNTLFPGLQPPPPRNVPPRRPPENWSPEARALSQSLLRTDGLLKLEGGIEMSRVTEYRDPRWNRKSGGSSDLALYSPTAWLTHGRNPREQTLVAYCNAQERGVYSLPLLLGRSRASVTAELQAPPLSLSDFSLSPLTDTYAVYTARVEPAGENQVKLILTLKDSTQIEHFTIDTARHVVVKHETFNEGQVRSTTTYSDFVEVAGSWWARTIAYADEKGRTISETKLQIQALAKGQYTARMNTELAAKPTVQFVRLPFVTLRAARQKVADGSATFEDRLSMILYNASLQQWDEMWKHVEAAEKLAADKPGVRWLRTQLLVTIRRNEEARQRLLDEAKQLVAQPQQNQVFLSEFIMSYAYGITGWPEFLEFVQLLKPVYERPVMVDGMAVADDTIIELWNERLLQSYDALGRQKDSLAIQQKRAAASPWHLHWQEDYARRLSAAGQHEAAHAWLRQEVARPERTPEEDDSLRTAVAELYRQQAQWTDLLKWTTEWIARNPESVSYNSAYGQHIAAMIYNDQLDQAYALADQWLKDACGEGKLTKPQRARLETALNFANGSLPNLNFNRMNPRWFEPLAEAARCFVRLPDRFEFLQRAVSNHYFIQSDLSDQLRGEWLNLLRTKQATLSLTQINTLVGWTLSGRMELAEPLAGRKQLDASEIPNDIWQKIASELLPRWEQATEKADKHVLSESLRSIYATRFADTLLLPFLRQRIPTAHPDYQSSYISSLFEVLLTTKWSEQIEQEAFAVWRTLYQTPEPAKWSDEIEPAEVTRLRQLEEAQQLGDRLAVEIPALYRLVDAMLANRISSAEQQLNDQGEQDKLNRKELAAKKAELRKTARTGLAARLSDEAKKAEGPLASWLKIEQLWLDVQLEQNLAEVEAECWKILGDAPPKPAVDDDSDDAEDEHAQELASSRWKQDIFHGMLQHRAFTTVLNLAVRKSTAPASIDRVLKYIDAGIAQQPPVKPAVAGKDDLPADEIRKAEQAAAQQRVMVWKLAKFRLLVALDRPDDLDRDLREWIRTDVTTAPWRQWLARLVAERGKLDEAIQLFEACEKDKLLTAADYRMLGDWYLVANRRDAYERTRIEAYKQMPEGNLSRMIWQINNRWTQAAPPSELDENTLFAFKALFEKSANPEQYLHHLQTLYAACRDYRLLQMLPDAVLGRSPQQAYTFLQTLYGAVLQEVRNEATADEILARVKLLRDGKLTSTDLRALDLLEALVERKSSEVLNQPGPHIDACVAALQRAFKREWTEGEPRMMSNFLFQLGTLPNEKLRAEQLRELRELQKLPPAATRDHLLITADLSRLIFGYGMQDAGIQELEVEVNAYVQANEGFWPHQDNEVLGQFVSLYEQVYRHTPAENVLKRFIARPQHADQAKWLNDRLMYLYNHALEHDGAVSIGTGRVQLFDAIVALSLKELAAAPDENVRYSLISRLNTTFDTAHRNKVPATPDAVRKYAFETLPAVLKQQTAQYRNTASTPIYVIGEALGPKVLLQYIVERMEQYPQRLEIQWDNSWQTFASQLGNTRESAGSTDLDARVLKLAITHLKDHLRTGEGNNPYIYTHNYYFWAEKTDDFARAAEEVLNERRLSGRRAMIVARYLHNGLLRAPRAIEILLIAHKQGLLEEASQVELTHWLRNSNRHAETIPILEPLVAVRPDNINYRTELMVAYHQTKRAEQLAELIQQTHDHFHAGGRWTEGNAAQFARGCQGTEQWERAKQYITEAIVLHKRANPASGINDSTLSDYNQQLARVEARLNHTVEAVAAASEAIICWDMRHEHRTHALNTLREVISASQNLDAYVAHLDAEAKRLNQDSAILRKAVGQTYQARSQHAQAIAQFKVAIDLQPNDAEIHQALIACYDATQNAAAATRQLLQLIDLKQHDLALYQQLAERMKDNEPEAERAATSIIESAPNEAESHAAMAELRQKQNRWAEAIPHWQQVAEMRRLEPTGLLKLAEAQVHEKQWSDAKQTITKLQQTVWPSRFNEVGNQTRHLQEQLPK